MKLPCAEGRGTSFNAYEQRRPAARRRRSSAGASPAFRRPLKEGRATGRLDRVLRFASPRLGALAVVPVRRLLDPPSGQSGCSWPGGPGGIERPAP